MEGCSRPHQVTFAHRVEEVSHGGVRRERVPGGDLRCRRGERVLACARSSLEGRAAGAEDTGLDWPDPRTEGGRTAGLAVGHWKDLAATLKPGTLEGFGRFKIWASEDCVREPED